MGDDLIRNHVLSEAHVFVKNLFYNPERRISDAQMDQVIDLIGTNFYQANSDDLQVARDVLAEIYDVEDIKSAL